MGVDSGLRYRMPAECTATSSRRWHTSSSRTLAGVAGPKRTEPGATGWYAPGAAAAPPPPPPSTLPSPVRACGCALGRPRA